MNGKSLDIECRDADGNTPLLLSAKCGNVDICEFLLKKGANIHARNDVGGTALHRSVRFEHCDLTRRFVLKYHADVNAVNNQGK